MFCMLDVDGWYISIHILYTTLPGHIIQGGIPWGEGIL